MRIIGNLLLVVATSALSGCTPSAILPTESPAQLMFSATTPLPPPQSGADNQMWAPGTIKVRTVLSPDDQPRLDISGRVPGLGPGEWAYGRIFRCRRQRSPFQRDRFWTIGIADGLFRQHTCIRVRSSHGRHRNGPIAGKVRRVLDSGFNYNRTNQLNPILAPTAADNFLLKNEMDAVGFETKILKPLPTGGVAGVFFDTNYVNQAGLPSSRIHQSGLSAHGGHPL